MSCQLLERDSFQKPKDPLPLHKEIPFPHFESREDSLPDFPDIYPSYQKKKEIALEPQRKVYQAFFSEDEKYFIISTSFKVQRFTTLNPSNEISLNPRKITGGGFTGIAFFPNGERFVAGISWEKKAYQFDWDGNKHAAYSCSKEYFYTEDVAISEDGEHVAISCHNFASGEKFLKLFDKTGKEVGSSRAVEVYLSQSRKWIVSFENKTVTIKNWKGGEQMKSISSMNISNLAFSPVGIWLIGRPGNWEVKKEREGKLATVGNIRESITTYNPDAWIPDQDFKNFVSIDPEGKYFITGSNKGACIWSWKGECLTKLDGHDSFVSAVTISNSGKYLITASREKAILWEKK
jgi:WD40 repeat protein